jgi:hypothetical protein
VSVSPNGTGTSSAEDPRQLPDQSMKRTNQNLIIDISCIHILIQLLISNLSSGTHLRKPTAEAGVSPSPNQTETYADTMRDNCTEPKQFAQKGNT